MHTWCIPPKAINTLLEKSNYNPIHYWCLFRLNLQEIERKIANIKNQLLSKRWKSQQCPIYGHKSNMSRRLMLYDQIALEMRTIFFGSKHFTDS